MSTLGVSVHTAEEAHEAEKLGATYVIAGHVFRTPSKEAYSPIGVSTVKDICNAVSVPVYALGGVNPTTVGELKATPVKGIALMSGLWKVMIFLLMSPVFKSNMCSVPPSNSVI